MDLDRCKGYLHEYLTKYPVDSQGAIEKAKIVIEDSICFPYYELDRKDLPPSFEGFMDLVESFESEAGQTIGLTMIERYLENTSESVIREVDNESNIVTYFVQKEDGKTEEIAVEFKSPIRVDFDRISEMFGQDSATTK